MDDRFASVKEILTTVSAQIDRELSDQRSVIRSLRATLIEIAAIARDDHGNGFRLAVELAGRAVGDLDASN